MLMSNSEHKSWIYNMFHSDYSIEEIYESIEDEKNIAIEEAKMNAASSRAMLVQMVESGVLQ